MAKSTAQSDGQKRVVGKLSTKQLKRALSSVGIDYSWVKDRSNLVSLAQEAFGPTLPLAATGEKSEVAANHERHEPSVSVRAAATRTTALAALSPSSNPAQDQGILLSAPPSDGTALAREWSTVWEEALQLQSGAGSAAGAAPPDGKGAIILGPPPAIPTTPFERRWRSVWDDARRLQRAAKAGTAPAESHPHPAAALRPTVSRPVSGPPERGPAAASRAKRPPMLAARPAHAVRSGTAAEAATKEAAKAAAEEAAAGCAACLRRWSPSALACAEAACPAPSVLDQEQVRRSHCSVPMLPISPRPRPRGQWSPVTIGAHAKRGMIASCAASVRRRGRGRNRCRADRLHAAAGRNERDARVVCYVPDGRLLFAHRAPVHVRLLLCPQSVTSVVPAVSDTPISVPTSR